MSICDWLSDRMPSVALGQAKWSPEEARHLSGCAACRAEWSLVQATGRLGATARLVRDPDVTARAVLLRLESPGRYRGLLWGFSGLAAAAVAAAIWVGEPATPGGSGPETAAVAAGLPLPELDALHPAELDSVLTTMDDSSASSPPAGAIGLGDLDSEELQRVLDTWEG